MSNFTKAEIKIMVNKSNLRQSCGSLYLAGYDISQISIINSIPMLTVVKLINQNRKVKINIHRDEYTTYD